MPKKSMRSRSRSRRGGSWYNPFGSFRAIEIMRDYTGLGPFTILNGRLVYN